MPVNKPHVYLIAYDIADPRRLSKVHRILKKQGLPLQYSVFNVVMTRTRVEQLLARIEGEIKKTEDDVRCYRLPANAKTDSLGRQYFPEDVFLFSNGLDRLLKPRQIPSDLKDGCLAQIY